MSALRLLFIYERGETHAAVRAFRAAFAELPETQLSFGADTLVFAGRDPGKQIRSAMRDSPVHPRTLDGVLVLLGPAGLDPSRTLEAIALREAVLLEMPILFVCAEGVRPPAAFGKHRTLTLRHSNHASHEGNFSAATAQQAYELLLRNKQQQQRADSGPTKSARKRSRPSASSGGTEVFSQDEIDALLSVVSSGEIDPDEYAADDFSMGDLGDLQRAGTDIESDELLGTLGQADDQSAPVDAGPSSPPDPVAFRAYLPEELPLRSMRALFVYAYLDEAPEVLRAVEQDIERFHPELGDHLPPAEEAARPAQLRPGTQLTVVPESEELVFEPPTLTKRWRGPWSRFAFDCEIASGPDQDTENTPRPGTALGVRVSIQVAGIEIAKIHCLTRVTPGAEANPANGIAAPPASPLLASSFAPARSEPGTSESPLARAKARQNLIPSEIARPYQSIFVSYSRRDYQITRAYETAQRALGNTVFVDTESLRGGEDWRAGLARAIDRADILQLFWSQNAARSRNVRDEWEYALKSREGDLRDAHFIRPVYWQKPIADVPAELAHLHFHFMQPPDE